jgi:hypothetical protein
LVAVALQFLNADSAVSHRPEPTPAGLVPQVLGLIAGPGENALSGEVSGPAGIGRPEVVACTAHKSLDPGYSLRVSDSNSLNSRRHASQLLKQGIQIKAISERLGHSSSSFTLDRYGHVLDGIQQEAARHMDQALRAAVQKERISGD